MLLVTECRDEVGHRALEVFGSGTAIWSRSTQIRFDETELTELLDLLIAADFAGMKGVYGDGKMPDAERPDELTEKGHPATRVTCRIALSVDGNFKQSAQLDKGAEFVGLTDLASSLLDLGEAQLPGVGADDLADAVTKLETGELAPETLRIMVQKKPDRDSTELSGFLLRLSGRTATCRPYDPQDGYGQIYELEITASDLERLIGELSGGASWPVNLWAETYTDLRVQILNHRRSVQARQFAGMDRATHGDAQKSFERLIEQVNLLAARILEEGHLAEREAGSIL